MSYPYDRDQLERTRDLLYALIPEFYKRRDLAAAAAAPPEPRELLAVVEALAAPFAALRQSVEELHADLFVESAGAEVLPVLAASIGFELVFRDAEANRRDLAAAMGWRRRKGTPAMLEEMARTLADRQVALCEGWKAVMLTQDLNLLRAERVIADLRPASVGVRATGPLATLMRFFDARPIGLDAGHAHPRHLVHWAFPTLTHPLRHAACHEMPPGATDRRFAFDAANAWRPLRVRATGFADRPGTDRAPDGLFAEDPGAWFGREGRFTVRLTGVPAAATRPTAPVARVARTVRADNALGRSPAVLTLIDFVSERCSGAVEIELIAAPLSGAVPDLMLAQLRGRIIVGPAGLLGSVAGTGTVPASHVMLLQLRPAAPAASRMLGETVIEVAGSAVIGRCASRDPSLALAGYPRGALYLRLPEQRVTGTRLFWIGADGSLHDAEAPGATPPLRPLEGDALPSRALISPPVGPVWPEAPDVAERAPFAPALAAPAAAPAVLHGGDTLHSNSTGDLPASESAALVFALSYFAGARRFDPMLRLAWNGADPRTATWSSVDASGAPLAADALPARFRALGTVLAAGPSDLALSVRFESSLPGAIFTPAEVAFTGYDGSAVLVHLPELVANESAETAPDGTSFWPRGPTPLARHSVAVQVGIDGSTWVTGTTTPARRSLGSAAPLPTPRPIRRREARWRRLCAWQNEAGSDVLEPTGAGRLDIDPAFGLFALNTADGVVPHPTAAGIEPPAAVSVDLQDGATIEIGTLPIDHRRFLAGLRSAATRIVSASGHLGTAAAPEQLVLPMHRTLAAALTAADGSGMSEETIEIVDSGYYAGEVLDWPQNLTRLEIRAAPFERPMIQVALSTPGSATYDALEVTGVALTAPGTGPATLELPPAREVRLTFLSVLRGDCTLCPRLLDAAGTERALIRRSCLGPLRVAGIGEVSVEDSIVDAGSDGSAAVDTPRARLITERVTIAGEVAAEEIQLSNTIVTGRVVAQERFRGCVRYGLVGPGSLTPRRHHVLESDSAGQPIRVPFESRDRRDPAWLRLDPLGDTRVLRGAADGGEMGAFNAARLGELFAGIERRMSEHTPAGLKAGIVVRP